MDEAASCLIETPTQAGYRTSEFKAVMCQPACSCVHGGVLLASKQWHQNSSSISKN